MRRLTLAYAYKTPQLLKLGALSIFLFLVPLNASAEAKVNRGEDVKFYGQVNKSFIGYADGKDADVGIYDNNVSSTRFGWTASRDVAYDLQADMLMEVQMNSNSNSRRMSQGVTNSTASRVTERHTRVGLRHNKMGALYVGRTSTASDGITEIDIAPLSNALTSTPARYGASLLFREKGTGAITGLQMSQVVDNFDGMQFAGGSASDGTNAYGSGFTDRFDLILYNSPRVNGVQFSAAAIQGGNHDFALRYKSTLKDLGLKVEAGAAYVDYRDVTQTAAGSNQVSHQWSGSASVASETGLAMTVAAGKREYEHRAAGVAEPYFYYAKLGYAWDKWGIAAEHGHYSNIDTTTTADTTLYSYGLGLERDLGRGVGVSAFARMLDLDRQNTSVEMLYTYGFNLRIKF